MTKRAPPKKPLIFEMIPLSRAAEMARDALALTMMGDFARGNGDELTWFANAIALAEGRQPEGFPHVPLFTTGALEGIPIPTADGGVSHQGRVFFFASRFRPPITELRVSQAAVLEWIAKAVAAYPKSSSYRRDPFSLGVREIPRDNNFDWESFNASVDASIARRSAWKAATPEPPPPPDVEIVMVDDPPAAEQKPERKAKRKKRAQKKSRRKA